MIAQHADRNVDASALLRTDSNLLREALGRESSLLEPRELRV